MQRCALAQRLPTGGNLLALHPTAHYLHRTDLGALRALEKGLADTP